MRESIFKDLEQIEYKKAWDYQENILQKMIKYKIETQQNTLNDYLIFCEHLPVYTLGKGGDEKNLLISENELLKQNIQFFRSNRGGDITFHGSGQIVVYPIFDLEAHKPDIGYYIRNLEEIIINVLNNFGIIGMRSKGETGVWLDAGIKEKERKICAIGVRCSRWVTMHGFAFNINTDLNYFNQIIPCGILNKKVTSLKEELKTEIDLNQVKTLIKNEFENIFKIKIV